MLSLFTKIKLLWRNTMLKKNLSLILAALITASAFASCASNPTDESEQPSALPEAATPAVEETEAETTYVQTLEARNLEGYDYRIVAQHTADRPNFAESDELTGEVLNDAVISRNQAVSDRLNIQLTEIRYDNRSTLKTDVSKTILAGDDAYDLVITALSDGINSMTTQNCFLDLTTVPHITLESERWNKSMAENMRIDGRQFFTTGVTSVCYLYTPQTVLFNKRIASENALPDLYECVLEGKWTVDAMNTYMEGIALDLNGDGNMTPEEDRYAFIVEGTFGNALYMSGGLIAVSADNEGNWSLNIGSEESVNLVDKCAAIFYDPSKIHTDVNATNSALYYAIFSEGRGLFTSANIMHTNQYRDMEDDFGILPVPVFNEGDPYLTACNTWLPSGIAIPLTCRDTEKIGLITETLAAYSHEYLMPAIIEKTLGKIARDSTSYQIMMMLYDNAAFDFNTIMNFADTSNMLRAAVIGATENFASSYKKIQKPAEKQLEKFIEDCRSLAQES